MVFRWCTGGVEVVFRWCTGGVEVVLRWCTGAVALWQNCVLSTNLSQSQYHYLLL